MSTEPIYLIGAGGHAKVVVDALIMAGVARSRVKVGISDEPQDELRLMGLRVASLATEPPGPGSSFHVCIGNARTRARLFAELEGMQAQPLTIAHPRSAISETAATAAGSFFAAGSVIGPEAAIGRGVIINHGAIVDHDCVVGAFSHIAPHATLGGEINVGASVLVGAGATILPGCRIGDCAVIGAGAVVTRDVPAGETYVGNPARRRIREY